MNATKKGYALPMSIEDKAYLLVGNTKERGRSPISPPFPLQNFPRGHNLRGELAIAFNVYTR